MGRVLRREQCPSCEDAGHDNLIIYHDESTHCFACGYHSQGDENLVNSAESPKKKNGSLLEKGLTKPLTRRKIDKETCEKYGVTISEHKGRLVTVFPFYKNGKLVGQKLKTVNKDIMWLGEASDIDFLGSQTFNGTTKRIVVTEGEEDALAVSQVVGPTTHVTSLVAGASSAEKFADQYYKKLIQYPEIVLCFDNDEAGQEAIKKFSTKFPVGKIGIAKLSEKDACDMLVAGKDNELKFAVLKAEIQRPDGIMSVKDLDLGYFEEKFEPGLEMPFPILNHYLGGLRKGELTMLASGTGCGKSTWCSNLIYDLIVNKGKTIVDIKLEESQRKTVYGYLAMHTGVCPRKLREDPELVTELEKREFLKSFSNLYVHNHFGSVKSEDLLNILDYYATIVKADFIFLDHISIAISGLEGSRDGERKDIDKLLTKIRELIDRTGVGFICVSHLRNPPNEQTQWEDGRAVRRSDLRGSGSLGQLSDNIIAIEGNLVNEDTKLDRTIKLIKTRYGDAQEAYCDTFRYDISSGRISIKKEVI